MLLAIPLGVFGAMYTAHFLHERIRRVVKPTIEIMAALPSVVLGFIALLWLAPRVERWLPGLFLAAVLVPSLLMLGGIAAKRLPSRARRHGFYPGSEILPAMALSCGGVALGLLLSDPFERWIFGGDYRHWFETAAGWVYDQQNAVVVGIAMGFAVIPVIFSISEDAFSNVPSSLISGSLALGANRWQTVTRVVLPTASAGVFSAIVIGFGRAIGETMIVVMATGNTPLLDWHPFNGFRTMSATIAVEIPEAPLGGTLYRTLFLTALLLFLFTFAVNTLAEIIRQRLRARYGQL